MNHRSASAGLLQLAVLAVLALLLAAAAEGASLEGGVHQHGRHHKGGHGGGDACPKCMPDACPKSDAECVVRGGLVPDVCGCCPQGVCGVQEGGMCYNASLKASLPAEHIKFGGCGDNLVCLLRQDLSDRDEPEALCVCKETQEACGSDGKTYETVCHLSSEAARTKSALYLKQWGPCASVPWIITGPSDSSPILHHGLAMDCEVKGFPIPAVHWEFAGDDGTHRILPSDDLYVAVQVRGGPEPYMVTSWLQIVDFKHKDQGTYTCVGTNDQGAVTASAKVGIRE